MALSEAVESFLTGESMQVSRRGFFKFGLSAVAASAVSSGVLLGSTAEAEAAEALLISERLAGQIGGPRTLSFYNTHTNEELTATYWRGGSYDMAALSEINYILRDFRTGDVHPMSPGLLNMLSLLHHRLGTSGRTLQIISGYRSPRTNQMLRGRGEGGVALKSYHLKGMAVDIRVKGLSTRAIATEARRLKIGGVGFYPSSDFTHIDVGPVRTWGA